MSNNNKTVKAEQKENHTDASDTFIDKYFNRKISVYITAVLLRTPLTANHVTIINTFIGATAAFFFAKGDYHDTIIGATIYQLNTIMDHCDGEIARTKNQSSKFGFILDLLTDGFVAAAVMVCIGIGISLRLNNPLYITAGIMAGTGGLFSCLLLFYDSLRRKNGNNTISFALNNKGKPTSTLETFVDNITNKNLSFYVIISILFGKLNILLMVMAIGTQIHWLIVLYVVYKKRCSKN